MAREDVARHDVPAPAPNLPSTDTMTLAAIASGQARQMQPKARWWVEDAVRRLEHEDAAGALAILRDVVNLDHGLMYHLERALEG